ncbi:MAG: FtsL-like putative cell division protein [Flavobacteriales bacterium AspAUS03]
MNKRKIKKDISIRDILKGNFLVKEDAYRNWNFILFLTVLALISITSSHMIDKKIQQIDKLHEEIRELKSEYASVHSRLMQMQLGSTVKRLVASKGLKLLEEPPYELILPKKKEKNSR